MGLGIRRYVAIAEIVVYTPTLIASILVTLRHGWRRASGWTYLTILCVLRIAGAVCWMLTYHYTSSGLLTTSLTLESVGISPLLLATLGLLSRLADWISPQVSPILVTKVFRLIQLVITLALILCVAGIGSASSSTSTDARPTIGTTTKAGAILYLVGYAGCVFVFFATWAHAARVPRRERAIYAAVAVAVPLIAVRLLYETLSVFVNNEHFAIYGGSEVINIAMGIAEEFLVAVDYVILGLCLRPLRPDEQGELTHRSWKEESPEQRQQWIEPRSDQNMPHGVGLGYSSACYAPARI